MIPIAIQTLDRPDYLAKTLKSLKKSGVFDWCSNIHVFDCGSSRDSLARVEDLCLVYGLRLHKSDTGKLKLHEGIAKMDAVLGEDFIRLEDDILLCRNWYPYVVVIMNSLESWEVINFYCLDAHNQLKPSNLSSVHKKGPTTHYGICLVAFKHGVVEKINRCKIETNEPFDIAMSLECGWYDDYTLTLVEGGLPRGTGSNTLCVHVPTLVQHEGEKSLEGAPPHRADSNMFPNASDFVGEDFDALTLITDTKFYPKYYKVVG
jgi:hypothetical protein